MFIVKETKIFSKWLLKLKDKDIKGKVGYCIYYTKRGEEINQYNQKI